VQQSRKRPPAPTAGVFVFRRDAGHQGEQDGMSESATADATESTEQTADQATHGTDDVSGLKSALEKERTAAREASKALKDAQKRIADFENKDKSETERLTAERDTLKTQAETALQKLQLANARSAVSEAAVKANAVSPRAVFALIREDLEYDDDGEPTNVAALLKQAQADEPSLFRKSGGKGDGGETGAAGASGTNDQMNDFIRSQARRGGRG
jgi:hypothetical protein